MRVPPIPPAELLRSLDAINQPDARSTHTLESHHAEIARITVSDAVPDDVAIQFETTRNLYLYAWHVYRFYVVAEMQALSTLELGLRKKLPEQLPPKYQRPGSTQPMLSGLLRYAKDHQLLRNEGYNRWHVIAESRARERRVFEAIQKMNELGLKSMNVDDTIPIELTHEDKDWDLVEVLCDTLPKRRNHRAHGSSSLYSQVGGTIELVAETLNQIYTA